jgi:uncharacterized protein YjbI with pentapeptide repeats
MNGIKITKDNLKSANWEEEHYKFCNFEDFSIEGGHVDSDFINCTFENIEWYWGMFNIVNFIDCTFNNCIFKGSSFPDCKFVECELNNCQFIKDNLDGDCSFENTKAYSCKVNNTTGFNVEYKNA